MAFTPIVSTTVTGQTVSSGTQSIVNSGIANSITINTKGYQNISSGGVANYAAINSGGSMNISSGGVASFTTIASGGEQTVKGGVANSTTINGADGIWCEQIVSSGGVANNTIINYWGDQYVEGGTASNTTVNSGGDQYIVSGVANSTTVNLGGDQYVASATANNTIINSGGGQYVGYYNCENFVDAMANSTTVNSGGLQDVQGGTANSTTINFGGHQTVEDGGAANNTVINSGGSMCISGGGVAMFTKINSGGSQTITSGGVANSTTINYGVCQNVFGGVASNTIINSGGSMCISGGGTTNFTTINSGGSQIINSGGVANSDTINSGGSQIINSGGVANSTTINDHGIQKVFSAGMASDTIVNSGGSLYVSSGGTVSGALTIAGGHVTVEYSDNLQPSTMGFGLATAQVNDALLTIQSGVIGDISQTSFTLDVNNTATGSYILGSGADLTGLSGAVFTVADNGQSVNVQVGYSYTFADGDKLSLKLTDAATDQLTAVFTTGEPADTIPPSIPDGLNRTISGNSVALTWNASTDNAGGSGVKQYQVQVDNNSNFSSPEYSAATVTSAATVSLTDGIYYWEVRTQDNAGNYSAWSLGGSFIVDITAPSVPANLTRTVTGNNVALDWADATDNLSGFKQYQVQVDNNSNFGSPEYSATPTASAATVNSLADGVYYWEVRAQDNSGNYSAWSAGGSFIVDTTAPTVPSGLTKTLNGKNVTLDWNSAADATSGVKQYQVQVDNNSNFSSPEYSAQVAANEASVANLAVGTYYWHVRTEDNSGNWSNWSTAANFIVELTPPTVPGGLKQTVTGSNVAFNWTASTDASGIRQYQVQVDNNSNFSSPEYSATPATNAASVNSLAVGTYYWEVRSQDNAGNYSAWSKSSSFMVTPVDTAANTWQTATDIGAGVDNWVGFGDAADVYKLTMANAGTLTLGLTGLSGNADLSLLSSAGGVLKSSANAGTANESVVQNLLAGTYYVKVAPGKGVNSAYYTLTNTENYFPTDTAANDYKTAKDINAGVDNWVGFGDAADVYKLTMANAGALTLDLTGLSGNADLSLLSSTGAVLKSSVNKGTASEAIAQNLLAGTYYIKIAAGTGITAAAYTMNDQISYYPGDTQDKAGNTIAAAKQVDPSLPAQTGWVGFGDSDDYYRFDVATATQGTLRLDMTGGNADLSLYDAKGKLLQKSAHTGTLEDVITGNLAVGTYYARVNAVSGNNSIDYTLEFSKKSTAGILAS